MAQYLRKVGEANSDFKVVLEQKAKASEKTAKLMLEKCSKFRETAPVMIPIANRCDKGSSENIQSLMAWKTFKSLDTIRTDPKDESLTDDRRAIFGSPKSAEPYLDFAQSLQSRGQIQHTNAVAFYGLAQFPEHETEFRTILGCNLLNQGLLDEAKHHLSKGNDYKGLKVKCENDLSGWSRQ